MNTTHQKHTGTSMFFDSAIVFLEVPWDFKRFQRTKLLPSATAPSLHNDTAKLLSSKGCIRELLSHDDVGKI